MIYAMLSVFCRLLFRYVFRTEVIGKENVPKTGGMILSANHVSNWDPPFLGTFIDRHVNYMAKEELFVNPIFSWLITQCHAFPVKRGIADRGAIKTALSRLKDGKCVAIFPEGTRSKTGELGKAETGVGLLAAMSKVPVVPAAIIGTREIFSKGNMFPKLKVIYGKPMYYDGKRGDKEAMADFSQSIMQEIAELIKINTADKK